MDNKEEITIRDIEDYVGGKQDGEFSHQALVMRASQKCLDAGIKEMRAGFMNQRVDRTGNLILQYVDDTRKAFIEAVQTLEMVMICDFKDKKEIADGEDEESTKKELDNLKGELKTIYDKLCLAELEDWNKITTQERQQRLKLGITAREGVLHQDLAFYQEYVAQEVRIYREIFKVLTILTKKNKFYVGDEGSF